jgi:flagellar hook assembly protein FlgD
VAEGANTAVWNGRDNTGRVLPAGAYTLQVRAVTPEGDVTRRTIGVVVTGR